MVVTCSMWLVSALLGIGDPLGFNQDYSTQIQQLAQGGQKVRVVAAQASAPVQSFTSADDNISVKDLLGRFVQYGANVVVNDKEIPTDTMLSFTVHNVPLADAMDAFAIAIRAHWEHAGQVWILKPGTLPRSGFGGGGFGGGSGLGFDGSVPAAGGFGGGGFGGASIGGGGFGGGAAAVGPAARPTGYSVPAVSATAPDVATEVLRPAPAMAMAKTTFAVGVPTRAATSFSVPQFVDTISNAQWTKAWSHGDSLRWSDLSSTQRRLLKRRYGVKASKSSHEFRWAGRRIIVKP